MFARNRSWLLTLVFLMLMTVQQQVTAAVFDLTGDDWSATPFGNWQQGTSTWSFPNQAMATASGSPSLTYSAVVSSVSVTWNATSVNAIQISQNFGAQSRIFIYARASDDGGVYVIGSNQEDDDGMPIIPSAIPVMYDTKPRLLCPAAIAAGATWIDAIGDMRMIQSLSYFTYGGLPGAIRMQVIPFMPSIPRMESFIPGVGFVEDVSIDFRFRMPAPIFDVGSLDFSTSWIRDWTRVPTMWTDVDRNLSDRHFNSTINSATVESISWNAQTVLTLVSSASNQFEVSRKWLAKGPDNATYVLRTQASGAAPVDVIPAMLWIPAQPELGQVWHVILANGLPREQAVTALTSDSPFAGYSGVAQINWSQFDAAGAVTDIGYHCFLPGVGNVEWDDQAVPAATNHKSGSLAGPLRRQVPQAVTGIFGIPDANGNWATTTDNGLQTDDQIGFEAILPSGFYLHYKASDILGGNGPEIGVWEGTSNERLRFSSIDDDNGNVGFANPGQNGGVTDVQMLSGAGRASGHGDMVRYNRAHGTPESVVRWAGHHAPTASDPYTIGFWSTADGAGLLEPGAKGFVFLPGGHYLFFERVLSNTTSGTFLVDYGLFSDTQGPSAGTYTYTFNKHGGNAVSGPADLSSINIPYSNSTRQPVTYGAMEASFVIGSDIYRDVINGIEDGISNLGDLLAGTDDGPSIRVAKGALFEVPLTQGDLGRSISALYQGAIVPGVDIAVSGTVVNNQYGLPVVQFQTFDNGLVEGDKIARVILLSPFGTEQKSFRLTMVANPVASGLPAPAFLYASQLHALLGARVAYYVQASNALSFSASGLPAGLAIEAATGLIYGRATVTGEFNATITATGPGGSTSNALSVIIGRTLHVDIYGNQLVEGEDSRICFELNHPAPVGGYTFTVRLDLAPDNMGWSDLSNADVIYPSTVTVPEGAYLGSIPVFVVDDDIAEPLPELGDFTLTYAGGEVVGQKRHLSVTDPAPTTLGVVGAATYSNPITNVLAPLAGATITIPLGMYLEAQSIGRKMSVVNVATNQELMTGRTASTYEFDMNSVWFIRRQGLIFFPGAGTYTLRLVTLDGSNGTFTVVVTDGTLPQISLPDSAITASAVRSPAYSLIGAPTTESLTALQALKNLANGRHLAAWRWNPTTQGWTDSDTTPVRPGETLAFASTIDRLVTQSGTSRPFLADVITATPKWNLITFPAAAKVGATTVKTSFNANDFYYVDLDGWLVKGTGLGFAVGSNIPNQGFISGKSYWVYNGYADQALATILLPPKDGPGVRTLSSSRASRTMAPERHGQQLEAPVLKSGRALPQQNESSGGCGFGSGLAFALGSLALLLRLAFGVTTRVDQPLMAPAKMTTLRSTQPTKMV